MQRVFFNSNNDYKPSDKHTSDPLFIPLAQINDLKSQKNGTKKTVFWVKKKEKSEDGTIKGEKYETSEQYIGDWKENKKDGYGINYIQEIGKIIRKKVMEFIFIKMVLVMMVYGKIIKEMEKV